MNTWQDVAFVSGVFVVSAILAPFGLVLAVILIALLWVLVFLPEILMVIAILMMFGIPAQFFF